MKRKVIAAVIGGLLVGCSQPTPGTTVTSQPGLYVQDMGDANGKTVTINLAGGRTDYAVQDVADGWALSDIYCYDVSLYDVTDSAAGTQLVAFTIVCNAGHAKAEFDHLRTGRKYQVRVVARGNHGGTAGDTVLNAGTPAVGVFDLTDGGASVVNGTINATIQVRLDGGSSAGTHGSLDIIPLAGTGTAAAPITGYGACVDPCGEDHVLTAGTTSYDSTFAGGTNGDPFGLDPDHNHWTNSNNWSSFVQRDLGGAYWVDQIGVAAAGTDARLAPCTKVYVKLRLVDGTWVSADYLENTNLTNYKKVLPAALKVNAFRLEMYNANGWFGATGITLWGKNDCGSAPSAAPSGTPASATPTPACTPVPSAAPSVAPSASPSAGATATPKPSAAPTATPTPAPTATPTPAPTATPKQVACTTYQTFTQGGWGASPSGGNPGTILAANWSKAFPNGLTLGTGSRTVKFSSAVDVTAFLPQGGTPASFVHSGLLTAPLSTGAGVLGGQLAAFKINLAMSDANVLGGSGGAALRCAKLVSGPCVGLKLSQVEAIADKAIAGDLSGLPGGCTLSGLNDVLDSVNQDLNGALPASLLQCASCD